MSIENLQPTCVAMSYWISEKRLKIDHFECGISEQFPIAYDGIHMKLLNVELFISNALTFSYICFSISMFSLLSRIWALAPPPSRLGIN